MAISMTTKRMSELPGLGTDPQSVRLRIEAMERLLERLFVIPGVRQPIGLKAMLDLIPVVGDATGALLGAYIVWEARNLGMSKWQMARMLGNVGVNWLLGLIPVIGVIPDWLFRSNTYNLRIIKKHLDKHHPAGAMIEGKTAAGR